MAYYLDNQNTSACVVYTHKHKIKTTSILFSALSAHGGRPTSPIASSVIRRFVKHPHLRGSDARPPYHLSPQVLPTRFPLPSYHPCVRVIYTPDGSHCASVCLHIVVPEGLRPPESVQLPRHCDKTPCRHDYYFHLHPL